MTTSTALKMHPSDTLFAEATQAVRDFAFDHQVAQVFDDMVDRSVPFYSEIQRMISEISADYMVEGTRVYDLGCATGTTIAAMASATGKDVHFVGLDNSSDMLHQCEVKLKQAGIPQPYTCQLADLNGPLELANASVVVLVLTLQFVRPLHREHLIRSIYEGLNDQGCLILVEKVLGESSTFNRQFIEYYYQMKRSHGYSETEIARKREALENVLIPYTLSENHHMLERCGFQQHDVFFKWYNFCGLVAVK
ncbi:MAG: carboxy-S-adenosyl-L-methionine synthase CmoA [Kiritimatiellae bacterium]|nr:carboxy-S-adenosyl-L-methionine synthase CmoA [Kiritimatiellia bacterium]